MARYRKTEADQNKLIKDARRYQELLEYADGLETYKDSSLWETLRKALLSKASQYGELVTALIDDHRKKFDPMQFQIEVTVARRAQKICQELAEMPKNMIDNRAAARKELDRINRELKVKPGTIYRDPSASSSQ
jgi:hypothetical protein